MTKKKTAFLVALAVVLPMVLLVIITAKPARSPVVVTSKPARAPVMDVVWRQQFKPGDGGGGEIAIDARGQIIIGENTFNGTVYLHKHAGGGKQLWTQKLDLGINGDTTIEDLAVDRAGNSYLVGTIFNYDDQTDAMASFAYIAKYGPSGHRNWLQKSPGNGSLSVAVSPAGMIYVANVNEATINSYDLSGKLLSSRHSRMGGIDDMAIGSDGYIYVVGPDSNDKGPVYSLQRQSKKGVIDWKTRIVRAPAETASNGKIALTGKGAIVVVANARRYIGGEAYEWLGLVAKYSADGKPVWKQTSRKYYFPTDAAVDLKGRIYAVGRVAPGGAFAGELGPDGAYLWTRRLVDGYATGAGVDPTDNLFVTGSVGEGDPVASFLIKLSDNQIAQ